MRFDNLCLDDPRRLHAQWCPTTLHTDEVGDSQPGCGFIITDDRGKSCIAIAYATSAEADAAAEKIRETLTSAIWTRCQNDLRK
jgi:hypothetical protein